MSELLNLIINKSGWETKITDKKIVNKWRQELAAQNVNDAVLDLVIDLLKNYKNIGAKKYGLFDGYPWVLDIDIKPSEYSIVDECNCKCNVCQGEEYKDESDYESDSNSDSKSDDNKIECKCTSARLITKRENLLKGFISQTNNLIDATTKKVFKQDVAKLKKSIPTDYHPGTNNLVIDLVHPSLYCYVKGVTPIAEQMDPNILFQWLPAEFNIKKGKVSINSYINNLDPFQHVDLYVSIANIFEKFVPKFQEILQILHQKGHTKSYSPLKKCQVIVKLADTVLTPESPAFSLGSWHLEGLPHEKIISTGIYYYEMTNITQSYLNFRTTLSDPVNINYPQNGDRYVETHYGFTGEPKDKSFDNTGSVIELGRVATVEDMCLVFPNFMQHQVSEFALLDKKKPGSRKILVFFLIDPSSRILSTADVKPQQSTMSLTDAKIYRELLMFQRKYEISDQNTFFERGWSLCEH
jgi:hypothetical protein